MVDPKASLKPLSSHQAWGGTEPSVVQQNIYFLKFRFEFLSELLYRVQVVHVKFDKRNIQIAVLRIVVAYFWQF